MKFIQLILFLSFIALTITFLRSKWFDYKIRKYFGQESDADDLLNQILDAEKEAENKQDEIKINAKGMKKNLDKLTKVRKTVSVAAKKKTPTTKNKTK
jgi:hypothetical protein